MAIRKLPLAERMRSIWNGSADKEERLRVRTLVIKQLMEEEGLTAGKAGAKFRRIAHYIGMGKPKTKLQFVADWIDSGWADKKSVAMYRRTRNSIIEYLVQKGDTPENARVLISRAMKLKGLNIPTWGTVRPKGRPRL